MRNVGIGSIFRTSESTRFNTILKIVFGNEKKEITKKKEMNKYISQLIENDLIQWYTTELFIYQSSLLLYNDLR